MSWLAGSIVLGGIAITAYKARRTPQSSVFNGFISPVNLPVVKIIQETHDTKRFVFKLPETPGKSGLTLTSMILASRNIDGGKRVIRPYTPINKIDSDDTIELLIKHLPNGKMSGHFFNLKEGDTMQFRGPVSTYKYEQNKFDSVTLLGAGSGITPLYQLASNVITSPDNNTKIKLLYGNKTINDIPLKKELDNLQKMHPDKFQVEYFVSESPEKLGTNALHVGNINKTFLKDNIPPATENTQVFVCGPTGFMKAMCGDKKNLLIQGSLTGCLKELGYSKNQVHKF
ncbi:NADH-cytochrome b5 reductase [Maudiozyma exigua]|uniref:NADH-cytochrome b5 reductase n=1 Tax=Maudiozyma exigua TaxID=34358 RepID=A0A9P6WBM6_MAUEX|nr:NADH-cytochrome b5 reductase [Kazachstania exigua]